MQAWVETAGVIVLALAAGLVGQLCSRLKKPWWVLGYLLPLVLVLMVVLAGRIGRLSFRAPFSWLVAGRREFVILGSSVAMLLATPLSRLRYERQRAMVRILAMVCVFYFSVLPFLGEALIGPYLRSLQTKLDINGVCLQSCGFTCGPAAAVTALRALGFQAEEGEIAALAHTAPTAGTAPDLLCDGLRERYAWQGLQCQYRYFDSIDELKDAGVTIAVVKYRFLVDHYVTVLDVTEEAVMVGDPLVGKKVLSHEEFGRIWRFAGIVLKPRGEKGIYLLACRSPEGYKR